MSDGFKLLWISLDAFTGDNVSDELDPGLRKDELVRVQRDAVLPAAGQHLLGHAHVFGEAHCGTEHVVHNFLDLLDVSNGIITSVVVRVSRGDEAHWSSCVHEPPVRADEAGEIL